LKGHVKHQYRLRTSIIEIYTTEEVIKFCSQYMSMKNSINLPTKSWNNNWFTSKCL